MVQFELVVLIQQQLDVEIKKFNALNKCRTPESVGVRPSFDSRPYFVFENGRLTCSFNAIQDLFGEGNRKFAFCVDDGVDELFNRTWSIQGTDKCLQFSETNGHPFGRRLLTVSLDDYDHRKSTTDIDIDYRLSESNIFIDPVVIRFDGDDSATANSVMAMLEGTNGLLASERALALPPFVVGDDSSTHFRWRRVLDGFYRTCRDRLTEESPLIHHVWALCSEPLFHCYFSQDGFVDFHHPGEIHSNRVLARFDRRNANANCPYSDRINAFRSRFLKQVDVIDEDGTWKHVVRWIVGPLVTAFGDHIVTDKLEENVLERPKSIPAGRTNGTEASIGREVNEYLLRRFRASTNPSVPTEELSPVDTRPALPESGWAQFYLHWLVDSDNALADEDCCIGFHRSGGGKPLVWFAELTLSGLLTIQEDPETTLFHVLCEPLWGQSIGGANSLGHAYATAGGLEAFFKCLVSYGEAAERVERFVQTCNVFRKGEVHIDKLTRTVFVSGRHPRRQTGLLRLLLPPNWEVKYGAFLYQEPPKTGPRKDLGILVTAVE